MTALQLLRLYIFPKTVYVSEDRNLSVVDRIENGEPVRIFYHGRTRESGVYLDKQKRKHPLFKYMVMLKDICRKYDGLNHGLMIGGGGLVFTDIFLGINRSNTMTAVEMDYRCIDIAKKYFGISENDRLSIKCMPGEKYISNTAKQNMGAADKEKIFYDFVLYDAYVGDKIAGALITEDMLKMVRTIMSPDGILAINVINDPDGKVRMQTYLTEAFLKGIFRYTSLTRCANGGNSILLASDRKL
ncbi:spermidine synthase [Butyrivibrio sp. VCD2006]|uniref:spermidine synthase n=1 Tax=Butyrivibrio sp. VCD2006 TaxID=1280664 RepID=UPI00047D5CEB|nr:hypothetical protein [Butyrivibrio sp. VCD2006]